MKRVPVLIGALELSAVLDSGSTRSLLNEAVCRRLQVTPSRSFLKLVGANGQPLENMGEVSVEITVDRQSFKQTFVVVPHLKEELLLLGDDFLRQSKAFIDWGTNSFSVQTEKPLKVYA
ncbi:MAG: retropepsin-like aspartic protease, partial [Anaplasma sp.]|nr:retropepsin-like aspartic protease [Anaplasma sp.]